MKDIQITLSKFLGAFSKLQLNKMMSYFAEDSTAFFPIEHHYLRLTGKNSIKGAFSNVIERIKASGKTAIKLNAEDLLLQEFGDTAIATFHIRDDDLSRRTLVLHRIDGQWLIEHLHASNAKLTESSVVESWSQR